LLKGVDELYKEKNEIVKTAIEMKMFLPISPKTITSDNMDYLPGKIMLDWTRSKKIDSDIVLNYLYLNEIEDLKKTGLISDD